VNRHAHGGKANGVEQHGSAHEGRPIIEGDDVERHVRQRLGVGIQRQARDLKDLLVVWSRASRFQVDGSEQMAVQVSGARIDSGYGGLSERPISR